MQSSHEDQSSQTARDGAGGRPMRLPGAATPPDAPTEMLPWEAAYLAPEGGHPDEIEGVDPFDQWAVTSSSTPGTSGQRPTMRQKGGQSRSRQEPSNPKIGRRKLVTLLAAGTAGVITVVTVGGISFARSPHHVMNPPSRVGDDGSISTVPMKERDKERDGDGHRTGSGEGDDDGEGKRPHKKPTPSPTQTQTPSPTQTPPPPPTSTPTKTPTPTGTVIGSTTQPVNSVVSFTNPADGQASWLVHMSNGNFVAVEQACTHAGVAVKYNASTGQFNCPAHGAIFNADGTHPQPPAPSPLPSVHITVNANGMITTP